jgi:hypothetical protein
VKSIFVKTALTAGDYVKANRLVVISQLKTKIILLAMPFVVLLGILSYRDEYMMPSILIICMPVVFLLMIFVFPALRIKKQFHDSEKMRQSIEWSISDEYLGIKNNDISEKWKWAEFYKFKVMKDYTFLFLKSNRNLAKFVAHKAFTDQSDFQQFHELLKRVVRSH